MFALIAGIVANIVSAVYFVLEILEKVNNAFMSVIANSKLFVTILLISISVAVWYFMNHSIDAIVSSVLGLDSIVDSVDSSFLSNFCTPSLLVNFSYNVLSAVVTYYAVFASGIGYSLLVKIHAMGSRSIVV